MLEFLKTIAAPVVNFISGLFTNSSNKKQVELTNAANMAMNAENIQFQREENEIARQREDTAIQRRASDLTAAGLSKTLAAGSPASANAMNAPNNQFSMQPAHAEAPRFDYDYASTKQALASAEALKENAATAAKQADTEAKRLDFEMDKFNVEHGFEVKKWSDEFEFNKFVKFKELSYEEKRIRLDQGKLFLDAVDLNDKLKNSMSEREYRKYQMDYTEALTIAARHEDSRKQELLKYDIAQAMANVYNTVANAKLSNMQIEIAKETINKMREELKTEFMHRLNIKAQTAETLVDVLTKIYNLGISKSDRNKTTDSTVGASAAAQNTANRHTDLAGKGISAVGTFLSVGAGAFIGSGAGGMFINKMLGMDNHNPIGFRPGR